MGFRVAFVVCCLSHGARQAQKLDVSHVLPLMMQTKQAGETKSQDLKANVSGHGLPLNLHSDASVEYIIQQRCCSCLTTAWK